jgi:hypothetical protein
MPAEDDHTSLSQDVFDERILRTRWGFRQNHAFRRSAPIEIGHRAAASPADPNETRITLQAAEGGMRPLDRNHAGRVAPVVQFVALRACHRFEAKLLDQGQRAA